MRPCETFQGPGLPTPLLRKDLGKKHHLRDPRAKSQQPDLDGYDLLVYFSRNQSCEGAQGKESEWLQLAGMSHSLWSHVLT